MWKISIKIPKMINLLWITLYFDPKNSQGDKKAQKGKTRQAPSKIHEFVSHFIYNHLPESSYLSILIKDILIVALVKCQVVTIL